MSQDCTDEAGKIKSSNPFIEEPAQSNTVVDMKGEYCLVFIPYKIHSLPGFFFFSCRCDGIE